MGVRIIGVAKKVIPLFRNPASQCLGFAPPSFVVHPPFMGTFGGLRRSSYFLDDSHAFNYFPQTLKSIGPVFFLNPKLLGLYNDHALLVDTPISHV